MPPKHTTKTLHKKRGVASGWGRDNLACLLVLIQLQLDPLLPLFESGCMRDDCLQCHGDVTDQGQAVADLVRGNGMSIFWLERKAAGLK